MTHRPGRRRVAWARCSLRAAGRRKASRTRPARCSLHEARQRDTRHDTRRAVWEGYRSIYLKLYSYYIFKYPSKMYPFSYLGLVPLQQQKQRKSSLWNFAGLRLLRIACRRGGEAGPARTTAVRVKVRQHGLEVLVDHVQPCDTRRTTAHSCARAHLGMRILPVGCARACAVTAVCTVLALAGR